MAGIDTPRPSALPGTDTPITADDDLRPPSPDSADPRTGAERKAALLEARALGGPSAEQAHDAPDAGPTTPGDQPRPITAAERKAALLEALALDRTPPQASSAPTTTDTPRTTDTPPAPEISERVHQHIQHGEWNRRGRPVGFHSAPDGIPPPDRRIVEVEHMLDNGVYNAKVEFRVPGSEEWQEKRVPRNSMFPDSWSSEKIREAVTATYDRTYNEVIAPSLSRGEKIPLAQLRGTYEGVKIQLYISPQGHLRTAFPATTEKPGEDS